MCYCDAEPPQAWRTTWRRARKLHRCCECSAAILSGDLYHYASGIWDHQPGSFKTCVQCVQVRDFTEANTPDDECFPPIGQLYDEIPRLEWPAHVIAAQEAFRARRLSVGGEA